MRVVALGGDDPERLRLLAENKELEYELLSDIGLEAAKAFGLAFHVSDDYVEMLDLYQLDTTGNSVETEQILPVPAVFVLSSRGVIQFSYVNPDYRIRCDPDVILAAARATMKVEQR